MRRVLLPRNVTNRWKVVRSYLSGSDRLSGFPFEIAIGITNRCNLDCVFCPNKASRHPRGEISLELLDRLIEQVAPFVDMVDLSFDGEPFLHPGWAECVEICHRRNVRAVLQTNCLLLDERVAREVHRAGLDGIILSLDAATPAAYARLKPSGDFRRAVENAERFLRLARGERSRPHTTVQFVRSPENASEEKEFLRRWRGSGADSVRIKPRFNFGGAVGEGFSRRISRPCVLLWTSLAVHLDGKIPLCWMEIEGRQIMGDAGREALPEIVNNEAFRAARRLHLDGRSNAHPICGRCDVPAVARPFVLGAAFADDFTRRRLIAFFQRRGLLQ